VSTICLSCANVVSKEIIVNSTKLTLELGYNWFIAQGLGHTVTFVILMKHMSKAVVCYEWNQLSISMAQEEVSNKFFDVSIDTPGITVHVLSAYCD